MDDTVDPDAEITFSRAGFEPIEPPRPLTEWEQAVVETIGREPGSLAVTEECRCGCASVGFLPPDPHIADIGHGARHVARPGMDQRVGELEGRDADGVPSGRSSSRTRRGFSSSWRCSGPTVNQSASCRLRQRCGIRFGRNSHLAVAELRRNHRFVWRRTAPAEITIRLDEIYSDLSGIIDRLMGMDAKLNELVDGLLEADGGEEEGDDG